MQPSVHILVLDTWWISNINSVGKRQANKVIELGLLEAKEKVIEKYLYLFIINNYSKF